jgi:hypothetical protein
MAGKDIYSHQVQTSTTLPAIAEHPNFSQEDFIPQPLPWILCVCPVATVEEPPEELRGIDFFPLSSA